ACWARAAAMPRMAFTTASSCRMPSIRAVMSAAARSWIDRLLRGWHVGNGGADVIFERRAQRLSAHFVQRSCLLDLADRVRSAAIERVAQAASDTGDGVKRNPVEEALLHREHERHLVGQPQGRALRLIEDGANPRAAGELLADPRIRHTAEAGEHLQFKELG